MRFFPPPLRAIGAALAGVVLGAAVPAQQFDELVGRGLPRERDDVLRLAFRDFDRDGFVDLLFADDMLYPGKPLAMLRGGPDGVFTRAPAAQVAAIPVLAGALVCEDFDGDGDIDVFVPNRDLRQNVLLLNDGTGRLVDATASNLPVQMDDSRTAASADVDRDGDLDIVVANVLGPDSLLLNDGLGHFTLGPVLPDAPSDDPAAMVFVDADADGDPDLFVADARAQDRFWINNGNGSFVDVTASYLPTDNDPATAAVAIDANRDGALDIVVTNRDRPNRLLRNDGAGRFLTDPSWMPPASQSTVGVAAFDADGDGDVDLVLAHWGVADQLLVNDGTGAFTPAQTPWPVSADHTNVVAAADVDNDGDIDVAFGTGRSIYAIGRKRLLLNDGHGAFASATKLPWECPQQSSSAIGACDVDGDGVPDVVVGVDSWVETWFGDGLGGVVTARVARTGVGPDFVQAFANGDVDGDGDEDLVVGTSSSNVLLRNNGLADLVADLGALPPGGFDTRAILLVDVDADGDLDVVEGNAGSSPEFAQPNRLLINDGTGHFTDQTGTRLAIPADFTFGLTAGDVDGDGDVDLVFGNWSVRVPTSPRQPNRLVLNDGTGHFFDAPSGKLPLDDDSTACVVLGDVDGDGDRDLVVGNTGQPCRLYRNDGTGTFTLATTGFPTVIAPVHSIALVDVELDGDLDVVLGNDDRVNDLLRNDGASGFVVATASAWPAVRDATTAIAVADLDGDGDTDLLVANRATQQDLRLANLARQVDVPLPIRVGRSFEVDVYARSFPAPTHGFLWMSPFLGPGLSLGPFGLFRLDPTALFDFGSLPIPAGTGLATFSIAVPSMPNLIGAPVYFQALVYDSTNLMAARLTNATTRTIDS